MADTPAVDLSLRQILDDPVMLAAFQEYCKTAHAEENLDFYLEVKKFEVKFQDTVTSARMLHKAQSSAQMTSSSKLFEDPNDPKHLDVAKQKQKVKGLGRIFGSMMSMSATKKPGLKHDDSASMRRLNATMEENLADKLGVKTGDLKVIAAATEIYKTFLTDKSDRWVCLDEHVSGEILKHIDSGEVHADLFDRALKMTYDNMEKDLVPRFNKSFHVFGDTPPINTISARGSVRFSPKETHKKHFDAIVGKTSNASETMMMTNNEEDAVSPAPPPPMETTTPEPSQREPSMSMAEVPVDS